jgi:hypothetical protein
MKRLLSFLLALLITQSLAAKPDKAHNGGRPSDPGNSDSAPEPDKPVREKPSRPSQPAQQPQARQERPAQSTQNNARPPIWQARQMRQEQQTQRQTRIRPSQFSSSTTTQVNPTHDNRGARGNSGFTRTKDTGFQAQKQGNNSNAGHARAASGNGPVHERLTKLGIREIPRAAADRAHILDTDRKHSSITFPKRGADGKRLTQQEVSGKSWNDSVVRTHMSALSGNSVRMSALIQLNTSETLVSHYYWHHDAGYDYCHYYDRWGYHWYGWYVGSSYFWTRYYNNSWWFFDSAFNRWCFWSGGWWWWQDPFHVGFLYLYDNGNYVPSQQDTAEADTVQTVDAGSPDIVYSNDNTRIVKIMGEDRDAFLYDATPHPKFTPAYLASHVDSAKFSDTSGGRPLQILVNLSNGNFEIFDHRGQSLKANNAP